MGIKSIYYTSILILLILIFSNCNRLDNQSENKTKEKISKEIKYNTFTDKRDGKKYKYVKIGNQTWMAENLAYKTDKGVCIPFENYEAYVDTFGYLYDWETAMNVAPEGWHIPSREEWLELINYIENKYKYKDGKRDAHGKLKFLGVYAKSLATNYRWDKSTEKRSIGCDDFPEYQNITGFSALPAGMYSKYFGVFRYLGTSALWWSSTVPDCCDFAAYTYGLSYNDYKLTEYNNYNSYKTCALSVRCIKD